MNRESLRVLSAIEHWARRNRHDFKKPVEQLHSCEEANSGELTGVYVAAVACQQSIQQVMDQIGAYDESRFDRSGQGSDEMLTETDVRQLLDLNRQLKQVSERICSAARDITERMEGKLADPSDPMVDYEMDARLDYTLREDDPAYRDDADSILASRGVWLKHLSQFEIETDLVGPLPLRAELHCWLFHDLYDHANGREWPRLGFKECLRIGQVCVEVEVLQQYSYEVPNEKGACP